MENNSQQQYLEEIKELGIQKLKLAVARTADAISLDEFPDPAAIEASEMIFYEKSKQLFESNVFIPLEYLFELFDCNRFERHCIMMALCNELDKRFSKCFAYLQEDWGLDGLTPYTAVRTWQGELTDIQLYGICHEDSLLMQNFFRPNSEEIPEMRKLLWLDKRIFSFILGNLDENEALKPFISRKLPFDEDVKLTSQQPDLEVLLDKRKTLVELYGEEGVGKKFSIHYYCNRQKKTAYLIHMDKLVRCHEGIKELIADIAKECFLFQAVPIISIPKDITGDEVSSCVLDLTEALLKTSNLVFITSTKRLMELPVRQNIERFLLEIRDMDLIEKRRVWKREGAAYVMENDIQIEDMANLFKLTYGGIKKALYQSYQYARSREKNKIDRESLQRGCYSLFEQGVVKKAIKVPSVYTWEDLVLPRYQKECLLTACNQVRYKHDVYENWGFSKKMVYGRGVGMIFAGAPGTGKTMAAQVFANELGIDMYKVELSAVVSKFVGETEKNLNEIFEQARQSQIILFFDEADVLFSKRTEVKDSNDKYSNMEAAFLLQKMEEYEGVTILATNLIQNFDEAFKRRVKFVIDFPFPDKHFRKQLWEKAMPAQLPREELDMEYLSGKFELSGSNIKNIILHAAFLAAARADSVNMQYLMLGIRNEYAKSGKILTKEDAGEYYVLLSDKN